MKQLLGQHGKQLLILIWATIIFFLYLYYLGFAQGGIQKALKLIGI